MFSFRYFSVSTTSLYQRYIYRKLHILYPYTLVLDTNHYLYINSSRDKIESSTSWKAIDMLYLEATPLREFNDHQTLFASSIKSCFRRKPLYGQIFKLVGYVEFFQLSTIYGHIMYLYIMLLFSTVIWINARGCVVVVARSQ